MVCYKNHVHVEDIFSILQARGSMLRTTAHHERALQVRPISSPTILFFGDANLVYSTSGGMLARPYFEPKFEPYFPPRPKSTTSPFVENVSFILLKEMESSSSCVRSENRCIMLLRSLRSPRTPKRRLRGSPKAGNAAKGNRFHKTVGNKGTNGGRGRQFYGLSVLRSPSVVYTGTAWLG